MSAIYSIATQERRRSSAPKAVAPAAAPLVAPPNPGSTVLHFKDHSIQHYFLEDKR